MKYVNIYELPKAHEDKLPTKGDRIAVVRIQSRASNNGLKSVILEQGALKVVKKTARTYPLKASPVTLSEAKELLKDQKGCFFITSQFKNAAASVLDVFTN